jgi:hypothetical protein
MIKHMTLNSANNGRKRPLISLGGREKRAIIISTKNNAIPENGIEMGMPKRLNGDFPIDRKIAKYNR